MSNKLYNIEFGTFFTTANQTMIAIPKQSFSLDSIEALKTAADGTARNSLFLELYKIDEDSVNYMLTYQVDREIYRNLKTIKKEPPAIRLSIARAIIEQDILNTFDGYVSIYPGNIWYHPMRTVKYAYRGNYEMPSTENESRLVRYKALLLYILIDYPFERALNKEYRIAENKYPLAAQIVTAESLAQLSLLIANSEDHILYENMRILQTRKYRVKVSIIVAVLLLVITNILNRGITETTLVTAADEEVHGQLQAAQDKITSLQRQNDINTATLNGDYPTAAILMSESGTSNEDIANYLYNYSQYNLALQYNPYMLEAVIQIIYNTGETDQILELVFNEGVEEGLFNKLRLEQAIVSYSKEVIDAQWLFSEDRHTLTRVAVAYINNGMVSFAEDVLNKMGTYKYSEEAAYINALVTRINLNGSLEAANASLAEAQALPEEDENKATRISEAENSVNAYTEQLTEAESNIEITSNALSEAWANEN